MHGIGRMTAVHSKTDHRKMLMRATMSRRQAGQRESCFTHVSQNWACPHGCSTAHQQRREGGHEQSR